MSANIEIRFEECTGCQTCVQACFVDVIRWEDAENRPNAAYAQDCIWCFTCEINCPVQCINVIPHMNVRQIDPF